MEAVKFLFQDSTNRGHFIGLGTIDRVSQDGDKDSLRSRLYAENFGDFHFHG